MYANLKGEMAKKNVQQTEIAKALKLHNNSVNNKINGKTRFTIAEAFLIKEIFFEDSDMELKELFKTDN